MMLHRKSLEKIMKINLLYAIFIINVNINHIYISKLSEVVIDQK